MKTKQKWFYPAQEKITNYLKEKFGECYRCESQDVCKYIVYEIYQCWKPKEQGKQQEHERVVFVIHKGASERNPQIIETCYAKYEDTMQYFKPSKTQTK